MSATPTPTQRKRDPKPFTGYTHKASCELCDHVLESQPQVPGAPPPLMTFTQGRHRIVNPPGHFYPHAPCPVHDWIDFGNIRANGHPNERPWRQLVCLSCRGYFLETVGTLFHAKQVAPD